MERTTQINKIISKMEDIKIFFTELAEKQQQRYDNMSERIQDSDKGNELSHLIGHLDDARDTAESLFDKICDDIFPED
jgi:hypothetical protein